MSRAISSVIDSPITPMVQYKFKLKYKYKYKYSTNTKQIQNKYRTNTNTNEQIHMTHIMSRFSSVVDSPITSMLQ